MGEENAGDLTLLEKRIIRQVEYYFGDVNLPRDKFLTEKRKEDEGWITLECLTTFNRLKEISTDLEEICSALKKSVTGLLEINGDELKVRRSKDKPLPDLDDPMYLKKKKMKTLYINGFPKTYTMDQVSDFFLAQDMQTAYIKLRKDEEYVFKGSVFVEMLTQEDANKLLENTELKCENETLTILQRDEYFQKKNEKRKGSANGDNEKSGGFKLERKAGVVLHFKGIKEHSKREDLKSVFGSIEKIAWVDFNMGETQGFIRFDEEGGAQRAIDGVSEKNDGKIIVNECELEVRVLEGEEEENYWKMTEEDMAKKKNQKEHSGGGRGRGRRGKGGRRGEERNFKRKRPWEKGPQKSEDGKDGESKGEHVRFDKGGADEEKVEAKKSGSADQDGAAKKVKTEEE